MYLTRYNADIPYETADYEYDNFVFQYESGLLYEQPETPYGGINPAYFGSTLVAELNRLANGGSYPLRTEFLEEAGAACKWAGLPIGYETVHALNIKAGITNPAEFLGLNGICNRLAGTSNLEAPAALRSIDS